MLSEVQQFINWVYLRNPKARTWKDYTYDLKRFEEIIGVKPLKEITYKDIDRFIEAQSERGLSNRSINRMVKTVSALFNYCAYADHSLENPVIPKRHRLRTPHRLPRPVPEPDLAAFFSVIQNPRNKAIFTLMLRCGLRISEVAGLKLDDLYLEEERPRIQVLGKNSYERSVYLSGQALDLLRDYLRRRPDVKDGHVFISFLKKGLSSTAIHQHLIRYRKEAGVQITAHQLRHSFGTNLVRERVPVVAIQKLMGHRWIETTMNYLEVNDPEVQADFFAVTEQLEGWAE
ncbi:MAG: tyrosine-type recombinase/integrase [Anaerolineae bacterium]|jgi:site-specific recombinase XerD|nr:tyrosine-type recombinase/integrase [Anaerolineae bacterium]MBT7070318.1 tyrosine-type recombinase/integrase [Anaerolineae bacterium]MBT7324214.1 tyrosine-type recombinase/integrase [Anaerolineae bacterium]